MGLHGAGLLSKSPLANKETRALLGAQSRLTGG